MTPYLRKKIVVNLLLITIGLFLRGQGSGEIQYTFIQKTTNYQTKGLLQFNQHASLFTLLKPVENAEEKKTYSGNNVTITIPDTVNVRPKYFIDKTTDTLYHSELKLKKVRCLTERIPKIQWTIVNEFRTLGGYSCQKATGDFRGRSYNVWFSPELALPYGPWKLQGLPGIILEALDTKQEILFSATKISLGKPVNLYLPKADETFGLQEYVTVIGPKRFEAFMEMLKAKSDRNTVITEAKMIKNSLMEINYEWEQEEEKN